MSDTNASGGDAASHSPEPKKSRRMKITWDEETIQEHDKLRGTRMKIDEPDTPYNGEYVPSDDEDDTSASGGNADALQDQVEGTGTMGELPDSVEIAAEPRPHHPKKHISIADQMDELQHNLEENPKSRWEEDDPEAAEKLRKKKAFEAKRAAHYNMAEQMRLAKLAIQKEMEEEEAAEAAAAAAAAEGAETSV
mgnify:CR=1 FL=1